MIDTRIVDQHIAAPMLGIQLPRKRRRRVLVLQIEAIILDSHRGTCSVTRDIQRGARAGDGVEDERRDGRARGEGAADGEADAAILQKVRVLSICIGIIIAGKTYGTGDYCDCGPRHVSSCGFWMASTCRA